jgi:predicted nucleic acid-binding protein
VSRVVFLDAGPLGLVTNPRESTGSTAAREWLETLLSQGTVVIVPEIADYEVRRELIRVESSNGLNRLDSLKGSLLYLPLTTSAMLLAAQLWARARRTGKPTADKAALDCDVILAAQAMLFTQPNDHAVIATTNVGHLAQFFSAEQWEQVQGVRGRPASAD